MKIIRFAVIGALVGGIVALVIVWLYFRPLGVDFGTVVAAAAEIAGIPGAVFGALVGLAIGVWKVIRGFIVHRK